MLMYSDWKNLARTLFLATISVGAAAPAMSVGGSIGSGSNVNNGVPNPASVYCAAHGGTMELFAEAAGQMGFCRLGRALIEEWTLFRGPQTQAAQAFLNRQQPAEGDAPAEDGGAIGIPNPASTYCISIGGRINLLTDRQGGQAGMCRFADNSIIDEWTLFAGPGDAEYQALVELLSAAPAP